MSFRKDIVEGVWDCPYCSSKEIRGRYRECPNCGRPRDENTTFRLPDVIISAPLETRDNLNPDWTCEFCRSLNSTDDKHCKSCGSPRTQNSRNYFENQRLLNAQGEIDLSSRQAPDGNVIITPEPLDPKTLGWECSRCGSLNDFVVDSCSSCGAGRYPDPAPRTSASVKPSPIQQSQYEIRSNINTTKLLLIILSIILALAAILLLRPTYETLNISEVSWKRVISIEKEKTFEESGWSLPTGARLIRTNDEFSHNDKVLSHYETRTRFVTKTRITEYDTIVSYVDLGNGNFSRVTDSVPRYETYTDTESYQEPVYKDMPVYKTKYYYKIDRYVHERDVVTEANDSLPYWGEVVLGIKERELRRGEDYFVTGINEKNKSFQLILKYDDWKILQVGKTVSFKIHTIGYSEIIEILN